MGEQTLNGRKVQKPPPTSNDAYLARQRQIAANRVSHVSKIHTTASVAAGTREIRDKDVGELTETFFLS